MSWESRSSKYMGGFVVNIFTFFSWEMDWDDNNQCSITIVTRAEDGHYSFDWWPIMIVYSILLVTKKGCYRAMADTCILVKLWSSKWLMMWAFSISTQTLAACCSLTLIVATVPATERPQPLLQEHDCGRICFTNLPTTGGK